VEQADRCAAGRADVEHDRPEGAELFRVVDDAAVRQKARARHVDPGWTQGADVGPIAPDAGECPAHDAKGGQTEDAGSIRGPLRTIARREAAWKLARARSGEV